MRHIAMVMLACAIAAPPAGAQAPGTARPTAAPAAGQAPAPATPLPTPPSDYVYAAEGRRDPFVPAIGRGPAAAPMTGLRRPPGVAGVATAEFAVRGILHSQGAWVAMVRAADGRTYTVHSGDRLFDGVVRAITADAVVISQEVNDPLSTAKQREVRKPLRGGGEGQ